MLCEFQVYMVVVLSCVWLRNSMDYSPPGSSVHGILQVRILEWVAISYSKESSQPRNWTLISCVSLIGRQILYHCTTWETLYIYIYMLYIYICCAVLSHSVVSDSLRPHGLEWVAMPSSIGSSQLSHWTQVSHIAGRFFIASATREAQEYWHG